MKMTLKALRVNAGLNQDKAAEGVGVSRVTIQSWEDYKTFPTAPQLVRLSNLYNCNLDDIFIPDLLTLSEQEG